MNLARELAAIADENLVTLRARWERLYGPPPRLRSVAMLAQVLAWRLQADALGGLDASTRRVLRSGSAGAEQTLAPGSTLTRE